MQKSIKNAKSSTNEKNYQKSKKSIKKQYLKKN